MNADLQYEEFLQVLSQEFPRFRIVEKRGNALSHVIDVALRWLTFGGQSSYMSHYHTVIGDTLYVPDSWAQLDSLSRVILLRHERIHLRQRRRLTFLGMAFLYLVPFFPLGLAYGRARLEWEAYTETLRATAELRGAQALKNSQLRAELVARFVGPDYGWMWPFPKQVGRWYDEELERILHDAE